MPQFSIIVPVYNVESYLGECLDSLLRQGYADWEAICINDGSTDGSGILLQQYAERDTRFKVISQSNQGLGATRNTGLLHATGGYVLFLDSDDWLEPTALQTIHNALDRQDMLCFGGYYGDREERLTAANYATGWDYYNAEALRPRRFPFVCVVLRCYRRTFLEGHQLRFREGILHEDNHFTPRACIAAGRTSVIPDALYHYHLRPGSIMTTRALRSRQDMLRVANDLSAQFAASEGIDKHVIYRALTHHYQAAFVGASRQESQALRPMVDWHLYHTVSRTRPRHRLNYLILRLLPTLYRQINQLLNMSKNSRVVAI